MMEPGEYLVRFLMRVSAPQSIMPVKNNFPPGAAGTNVRSTVDCGSLL